MLWEMSWCWMHDEISVSKKPHLTTGFSENFTKYFKFKLHLKWVNIISWYDFTYVINSPYRFPISLVTAVGSKYVNKLESKKNLRESKAIFVDELLFCRFTLEVERANLETLRTTKMHLLDTFCFQEEFRDLKLHSLYAKSRK